MAAAWRFGVQYETQCSIDPSTLIADGSNPVFYDLCILLLSTLQS